MPLAGRYDTSYTRFCVPIEYRLINAHSPSPQSRDEGSTLEEGTVYCLPAEPFGALKLIGSSTREIDETWRLTCGRKSVYADRCVETALDLQEENAPGRKLRVIVRAYDGGAALRYAIPEDAGVFDAEAVQQFIAALFLGNARVGRSSVVDGLINLHVGFPPEFLRMSIRLSAKKSMSASV